MNSFSKSNPLSKGSIFRSDLLFKTLQGDEAGRFCPDGRTAEHPGTGGTNPMKSGKIPLVVGVTGHIALRPSDRTALCMSVLSELKHIKASFPHSQVVLLTSLAAGGDLLCADAARELGIPLLAVLPMEPAEYRKDFTEADAARFDAHCAEAEQVAVVSSVERRPEQPDRAFFYRQASIYVATHCHVMLALWDGSAPDRRRCGTGAAVDIALHGTYFPERGNHVVRTTCTRVIHILAPREADDTRTAGEVRYLGNEEIWRNLLDQTETFNRLCEKERDGGTLLRDEACEDDPVLARMNTLYHAASGLSRSFAKTYRRMLALLATASTLLTFAFLLYDEAEMTGMIAVCGAMLGLALMCRRYAVRSDCHRRYIEYRALAEWLRVQAYLRYAGSRLEVTSLITWTQSQEAVWIASALQAVSVGPMPEKIRDIRACWIDAQKDYHRQAAGKVSAELKRSERVVRIALIASALLYAATLVFECLFGGMGFRPFRTLQNPDSCRTLFKVALGTLSAATIFIANYYGKQSLPRKLSDHGKMSAFYARISDITAAYGQDEALLEQLAREELIENGNWLSYQRDNTPDISL